MYSFELDFRSLTAALESAASWISICRTVHWRAIAWSSRWYAVVKGNWEGFGNAKQEKFHKPEREQLKSYPKLKGFGFCYTIQAMYKILASLEMIAVIARGVYVYMEGILAIKSESPNLVRQYQGWFLLKVLPDGLGDLIFGENVGQHRGWKISHQGSYGILCLFTSKSMVC